MAQTLPLGFSLICIRNGDSHLLPLLNTFYHHLIETTFEREAELLDPFSTWEYLMEPDEQYRFHADVLVTNDSQTLVGGLMYEFYPQSLCGILCYLVVKEEYRGQRLANLLVQNAKNTLDNDARELTCGKFQTVHSVFLETHIPPLSCFGIQSRDNENEEPFEIWMKRMSLFDRLGFQIVDISYLQPPLGREKETAYNLILLQSQSPNIPDLSPFVLSQFLLEFAESCAYEGEIPKDFSNLVSHVRSLSQLSFLPIKDYVANIGKGVMPEMIQKLIHLKENHRQRLVS
jgi:GNAT superfamily N-acetyltransferase